MMLGGADETRPAWSASARDELAQLAKERGLDLMRDEPLHRHTSFGVGGKCPLMLYPRRDDHVAEIVRWAARRELPLRVLGGGTNLLVNDAGVREPVINTTRLHDGARIETTGGHFPAGLPSAQVLHRTVAAGRDGFVWAAGLPGSLGGAAAGNAGCWGGDMAGSVSYLDVVDGSGERQRLESEGLRWSYRRLDLPGHDSPWFITAVGLTLADADPVALRQRYETLQSRKRERQPVGARNSGCIFRNPQGGSAGRILDEAGCKGMREGGAHVSERHANFIVNDGNATAVDVERLIERLVSTAREQAGVELWPEVQRW